MISKKTLHELFRYDSGFLYNRKNRGNAKEGARAGYRHKSDGYWYISIKGKDCAAHRLIWIYHYGNIPQGYEIDHINGIRFNNQIENLRCVTHRENCMNQTMSTRNKSGFVGVHFDKGSGKWKAAITVDGRRIRLGSYEHKGEAISIRRYANKRFGFHEGHGKRWVPTKVQMF